MVIVSILGKFLYNNNNKRIYFIRQKQPKKNNRTDAKKIQFKKKYNCDVCHVNNSRQVSLKEHFAGKNNTL